MAILESNEAPAPVWDVHCEACHGTGTAYSSATEEVGCGECNGEGRVLTIAGADLLSFLLRHRKELA